MIKLADMMAYDSERDIFNFPLAIQLHGEEIWLMVQADVFTGGKFYIVRGKDIAPCIFYVFSKMSGKTGNYISR